MVAISPIFLSAADGLPTYPTARENKPDRSLSPKTKFNFQKKQKLSNCKDPIKSPVLTISAENIDQAIKKIQSLGGKIIIGKMVFLTWESQHISKILKETF